MLQTEKREPTTPCNRRAVHVSVIIPVFNGEKDLPLLIERFLKQSYPSDQVEYIFVDNNSKDKTAEIILSACERAGDLAFTFRYCMQDKIQSSYASRNCGIRESNGKILLFTDADCHPHPDWISEIIVAFENPDVGLVGGAIHALSGNSLIERYSAHKKILDHTITFSNSFLPYSATANLGVRREVFERIGLFRPFLTTGGDADFCWRVQKESEWKLVCAEKAIIEHKHRKSINGLLSQFIRYGKSRMYLQKLHGATTFKPFIPVQQWPRKWGRWATKEAPILGFKMVTGQADSLDFCMKPLSLLMNHAMLIGFKRSTFHCKGDFVEYLDHSASSK